MRGSIWELILVVVSAGSVAPALGQANNISNLDPQIEPKIPSTAQPGSEEQRFKAVLTRADGSTAGVIEENRVLIGDAQGRVMFARTRLEKGATIGPTLFLADDHAAGTRTVWSTENTHAKMQKFPEGVPERSTCWTIAPEDQVQTWRESLLLPAVTCHPAAEHSCDPFGAVGTPGVHPSDGSSIAKGTYTDCMESLSGPPKQASKRRVEDLGIERILGFETHGCRVTFKSPEGTSVDEKWVAEFGLEGSRKPIVLRSVSEGPYYSGSNKLTAKTRIETTSFGLEEQAPATLRPPEDYTIETVEMHEVHCMNQLPPPPPAQ